MNEDCKLFEKTFFVREDEPASLTPEEKHDIQIRKIRTFNKFDKRYNGILKLTSRMRRLS
jgi:hypothetical protein